MNACAFVLALSAALTTAPLTPQEASRRLAEMSTRHRNAAGAVDTAAMSPADAQEYARLQAFLRRHDLEGRVKAPTACRLDELDAPGDGLCARDIGVSGITSALLAQGEAWAFVGLLTETMLPLPMGWQTFEQGAVTHLVYPRAEWGTSGPRRDIDPRSLIDVQIGVRAGKDIAAVHASYAAAFASFVEKGTLALGEPVRLDAGRGYFVVRSPQIGKVSLVFFAPDPSHKGEGFQCTASFFEERWTDLRPVLQTMLRHWYKLDGQLLGGELDFAGLTFGNPDGAAPAPSPAATADAAPAS